jgi:hypothetical protein
MKPHVHRLLKSSLKTCVEIHLSNGAVSAGNPAFARHACFAWLIINLNDALQALSSHNLRVDFTEDVDSGQIGRAHADVTDLIANIRNLLCHPRSEKHMKEDFGTIDLIYVAGKSEGAHSINGVTFGCPYGDDTAIFFGNFRIYYSRHISRALKEAHLRLSSINICE